jgi:hypothetical protein
MKSHPFFQRRHYQAVAEVLLEHDQFPTTVIHSLCKMFHADNPNFDEARFLKAAGRDNMDDED